MKTDEENRGVHRTDERIETIQLGLFVRYIFAASQQSRRSSNFGTEITRL
jgi:hypothetical protein